MRSKMIFLLALIMGIITTMLFFNYTKSMATKEVVQQETVQVVKAKETIAENKTITAEMLEVVTVPKENIHPQAVKEISKVTGKYAAAKIEKGEIILSSRVKDQKEEIDHVSRKIQEGYRAVSIHLELVQSVTNLIEPEDHVDVIFTSSGKNGMQSVVLFENIRVLAVGKNMTDPKNNESTTNATGKGEVQAADFTAVTLELKPKEAIALINATEKDGKRAAVPGNIHLTLHPSIIPPDAKE